MDPNIGRTDLLPATVPTVALALLALGALALWALAYRWLGRRRAPLPLWLRFILLLPVGSVASWCLLQWLARQLYLSGAWRLWTAAFVAGGAITGIALLYEREGEAVRPSIARALVLLRVLAVGIAIFVLLQPVLVRERARPIRRRVAVLVDDSASMQRTDTRWTVPEKLDVAQALGEIAATERPLRVVASPAAALRTQVAYWKQLLAADPAAAAKGQLRALVREHRPWVTALAAALAAQMPNPGEDRDRAARETLDRLARHVRDALAPPLDELAKDPGEVQRDAPAALAAAGDAIDHLLTALPGAADAADTLFWDGLAHERQARIRVRTERPRARIAHELLAGVTEAGRPELAEHALLPRLRGRYDVDLFRFGREALRVVGDDVAAALATNVANGSVEAAFRAMTDMTRALEDVVAAIPSEELAGVLLLTDGRHTGEAGVEAISRRLGQAQVPISSVVIGGTRPPFDVALAQARAPETVFLGDRVRVTATVRASGAKGRAARLRLLFGEETVAEETLNFDSDDYRREIRLADTPAEQGVRRYRLEVEPLEGEELLENNAWPLDVSVTDDRTNVLLVDDRPRWEFRYLRNLFYGRDKSVHLQYFLVTPDKVAEQPERDLPAASAARAFGDAEAGALPTGRDEWRKFDVIILGDLGEDVLTPEVVGHIRHCVEERGALLVVIAGPERMPYGMRDAAFRELLPIVYEADGQVRRQLPEGDDFRVALTPAGRAHEIMRQSASAAENEQIWDDLPNWRWRVMVDDVKPGAEVLAYARAPDDDGVAAQRVVADLSDNPEEAIRRLAEIRRQQARNALFVVQTVGQGKVLMLTSDRTWRLRYRIGDTLHHRFWGQVMRWGTGEKLRTGNVFARLGTDRVSYTPSEPVRILARLSDRHFTPLVGAHVEAVLSVGDRELGRVPLRFRPNSNGIYEGLLDPLPEAGMYTVRLHSPDAARALGADFPAPFETRFLVVTARRPAELVEVTADWRTPQIMAQLSAGRAVRPAEALALWDAFGEGSRVLRERVERLLWDWWGLFVLLVLLVTGEWLLRKKGGLA